MSRVAYSGAEFDGLVGAPSGTTFELNSVSIGGSGGTRDFVAQSSVSRTGGHAWRARRIGAAVSGSVVGLLSIGTQSSVSIACWFRLDEALAGASNMAFMSIDSSGVGAPITVGHSASSPTQFEFDFRNPSSGAFNTRPILDYGVWYHLAFSLDGTNLRWSVTRGDGVSGASPIGETVAHGVAAPSWQNLQFGAIPIGINNGPLTNYIDNLIVDGGTTQLIDPAHTLVLLTPDTTIKALPIVLGGTQPSNLKDGNTATGDSTLSITAAQRGQWGPGVNRSSQGFGPTGAEELFVVPDNVFALGVDMAGAEGGNAGGTQPGTPGRGARVQTTLAVTPGETLWVRVGRRGATGTGFGGTGGLGGFYAGAKGGAAGTGTVVDGGGGGGETDVRQGGTADANRVAVAGAGGGAASNTGSGSAPATLDTQSTGAVAATPGTTGGLSTNGGGGGGAGWRGGVGGAVNNAGVGGTNMHNTTVCTGTTATGNFQTGDGYVTLSWTGGPPNVVIGGVLPPSAKVVAVGVSCIHGGLTETIDVVGQGDGRLGFTDDGAVFSEVLFDGSAAATKLLNARFITAKITGGGVLDQNYIDNSLLLVAGKGVSTLVKLYLFDELWAYAEIAVGPASADTTTVAETSLTNAWPVVVETVAVAESLTTVAVAATIADSVAISDDPLIRSAFPTVDTVTLTEVPLVAAALLATDTVTVIETLTTVAVAATITDQVAVIEAAQLRAQQIVLDTIALTEVEHMQHWVPEQLCNIESADPCIVVGGTFDAKIETVALEASVGDHLQASIDGDTTANIAPQTLAGRYDPNILEADIDNQELC